MVAQHKSEYLFGSKNIEGWFSQKHLVCALLIYRIAEEASKGHSRAVENFTAIWNIAREARPVRTVEGFYCSIKISNFPHLRLWFQKLLNLPTM